MPKDTALPCVLHIRMLNFGLEKLRGGFREGKFALQYISMSIEIVIINCKMLQ
jgi:hypothetical protein